MAPAREDSAHPRSFDPGPSTGNLRREARDYDLEVELGSAPFDPGPGTGYDERRARRDAKRRQRAERQDRLAELEVEIQRRERAEREEREREERERAAAIERERAERERLARERADRASTLRKRRLHEHVERQRRLRDARARRRPRKQQGLFWPTARAGLAVAAVTAVAGVFGTAIGLPVPVLSEPGGPIAASLTGNSLLDAGTLPGPTKGPYFPVATDNPDYGEGDARFGALRSGHIHQGQDVFAKTGTPLVAVRDGIVIDGGGGKSFYAGGGGNSLVIYSPVDDRSYVYLHMLHPSPIRAGETVKAGQQIGQVGCTGSCWGPHLHFEIRRGRVAYGVERKAIDPLPLLQQWPAPPAQ